MSKSKRNAGAISYFHRRIRKFDGIYRDERRSMRFLNNTIRASVKARFSLTFETLGNISGRTVLDIGCGSGRYLFEALSRGAKSVIGLDAAVGALDYARELADGFGLIDKTRFINSDFLDYEFPGKFDIVLAIGYFDYVFNPEEHLKKMVNLFEGTLIASFPKLWSLWTPVRKIRLTLSNCPVRFYTKNSICRYMQDLGVSNSEIKSIFRDNILIIRK